MSPKMVPLLSSPTPRHMRPHALAFPVQIARTITASAICIERDVERISPTRYKVRQEH
jgi:hypothetical protein